MKSYPFSQERKSLERGIEKVFKSKCTFHTNRQVNLTDRKNKINRTRKYRHIALKFRIVKRTLGVVYIVGDTRL